MRKTELGVTLSKDECAAIRADVRCRLRQPAEPSQIIAQGFSTVDRDDFLWDRFDDPDESDAKEKELEALCEAELLIHTTALEDGRADDYFLDKLDSGLEQHIRDRIYIWKQPVYCPSRYRPRDELSVEELLHKWALHEEVYPDSRRRIRRIFLSEAQQAASDARETARDRLASFDSPELHRAVVATGCTSRPRVADIRRRRERVDQATIVKTNALREEERELREEAAVYALALALRDAHRARVKREEAARERCDQWKRRFRPGGDLHIPFVPARHPENAWGIPCPRDPDPEVDTPGSD